MSKLERFCQICDADHTGMDSKGRLGPQRGAPSYWMQVLLTDALGTMPRSTSSCPLR